MIPPTATKATASSIKPTSSAARGSDVAAWDTSSADPLRRARQLIPRPSPASSQHRPIKFWNLSHRVHSIADSYGSFFMSHHTGVPMRHHHSRRRKILPVAECLELRRMLDAVVDGRVL